MIKVLHLFETYLPKTENWVYNLINNIANIEIHIGAYQINNNFIGKNDFHYSFETMDNNREILMSSKNTGFPRILEKIRIKLNYITNGTTPKKLIAYCKKNDIQILHAHFGNIGCEFLSLKKSTGLPMIVSFYGWDYTMLPLVRPKYKKLYKKMFKEADLFLVEGKNGKAILENLGCSTQKIKLQKLGVDLSNIPRKVMFKNSNSLKLVQVANFNEKKGHFYSIMAFKEALTLCNNMKLEFIGGNGEQGLKEKMINLVKQLKLTNLITFHDFIDPKNLHKELIQYDFMIHPSCYSESKDCEGGAPVILLEAQAIGIPIISTKHCDIPNTMINNKTGYLSPEKDTTLLSKSIIRAYKLNNSEHQIMSQNSIKYINENHSIQDCSNTLESTYRALIKK